MKTEIFKLPPVGKLGKRPVSRAYMLDVEERSMKMKRACRPAKVSKQMRLNFEQKRVEGSI